MRLTFKVIALSWLALFGTGSNAMACDICGCASGNSVISGSPYLQRFLLGIRATGIDFSSRHPGSILNAPREGIIREYYRAADIRLRYMFNKNLLIGVNAPLLSLKQIDASGQVNHIINPGDPGISVGYILANRNDSGGRHWLTLTAGTGIPLAPYKRSGFAEGEWNILPAGLQPGYGAFTPMAAVSAGKIMHKLAFTVEAAAGYPLRNAMGYRRGISLGAEARAGYYRAINKTTLLPYVSAEIFCAGADYEHAEKVRYSGGKALSVGAGVEIWVATHWQFSAAWQIPAAQNLNEGYTTRHARLTGGINYIIPQKHN